MKYLNDTGLTKLWEKIKSKFALQTDLEVIDERTITLNSSVSNLNDEVVFYSESIGSLEDLSTSEQGTIVGAINELYNSIDSQSEDIQNLGIVMNRADDSLSSSIGNLSNLTTTAQTDLVSAINEVNAKEVTPTAVERNVLTARLESNYTVTTANVYEVLPLSEWLKIGNKLSVNSDGKIVIGAGVNHVKVCAVARSTSGTAANKFLTVQNSNDKQLLQAVGYKASTSGAINLAIPSGIFAVSEGEILSLRVYCAKNDVWVGTNTDYGMLITYMTVEVID